MKLSSSVKVISIYTFASLFNTINLATAQSIQIDGTTNTQPTSCSGDCIITGGLRHGKNLFHSFKHFNVDLGATVLFQNSEVTNIFGRVTSGEISEILGTLSTNNDSTNLFLINPNGIIFGANSSLNINGSFVATTANAIRFEEQGFFSVASEEIPLLTINPSALFFTQMKSGNIVNKTKTPIVQNNFNFPNLGLTVPDGKSLLLVGGDVIINKGGVNADGGRVELGGLAEAGEIQLNISDIEGGDISLSFPDKIQKADVFIINNSIIDTASDNGGEININADNLIISGKSAIIAEIVGTSEKVDTQTGNITFNLTKHLKIDDSVVSNSLLPRSQGDSGNIIINSGSVSISNEGIIQTTTFGQGNAGNIQINVPKGLIEIQNNSKITVDIQSINGDNLRFTAIGKGGDINIIAQEIVLQDNSEINASTQGQGNAGNINIFVEEDVKLYSDSRIFSGVGSGAIGNGGGITIEANNIFLDSGSITAETAIEQGGNITLEVDNTLTFENSGEITATAGTVGGRGDGGNVTINSDFILAFPTDNNYQITARASQGNGGDIQITTDSFFGREFVNLDASSNAGIDGNVSVEVLEVDPARGLTELPDVPVDIAALLAQNLCEVDNGEDGETSSFINIGRGGLPPNPYEPLDSNDDIFVDVQLPTEWREKNTENSSVSSQVTEPIVEASAWIINEKGNVELVSKIPSKNSRCGGDDISSN